jgi:hypothetical protein
MINIVLVIWLLFAHWVADFVCQSNYIAQQKSKDVQALWIHCFVYGLVMGVLSWNFLFGCLMILFHYPVDYVTSRINADLWQQKRVHGFFVSVGFDQFLHYVIVLVTWRCLS